MPEEHGITAIENTAGHSALRIESTAKKPLVWTGAQSCEPLKLRVRVSPLVLYSYCNEIHVIKLSHCMMILLSNQRLLGCCFILSILYFFVHSLQEERNFAPRCPVCPMCAIVIGILLVYVRFGSFVSP